MKSSLVWQLELVNYFVKNYNYQIIKLVDGRNQKIMIFGCLTENIKNIPLLELVIRIYH